MDPWASRKQWVVWFYPVNCDNVLIEGCEAIGASDAGIYVGQSRHVIVRNNLAFQNVAGIEIENTLYADVYDNEATQNTGGILVFDMPGLVQTNGGYIRVYNNNVHDNNLRNFAPEGNIVAEVPPGTGVLVLGTNHVEIFDNKIHFNRTIGTGVVCYLTVKEFTDSFSTHTHRPYRYTTTSISARLACPQCKTKWASLYCGKAPLMCQVLFTMGTLTQALP